MRRNKKIMRNIKKAACIILSLMLVLGSIDLPSYAQEQDGAAVKVETEAETVASSEAVAAVLEEKTEEAAEEEAGANEEKEEPAEDATEDADAGAAAPAKNDKEEEAPAPGSKISEKAEKKGSTSKSGDEGESSASKDAEEKEEAGSRTGTLRFVDSATEILIDRKYISIEAETSYDDGAFTVEGKVPGNVVSYRIKKEGYTPVSDSVVLYEEEQTIKVNLEKKAAPAEGTIKVDKTYGDNDFSALDHIDIEDGYNGKIGYEVVSGTDVASVKDDGTISIAGAGQATVRVTLGETETFSGSSVDIELTIAKCRIGEVQSEDIDWDGTEKEFDTQNTANLTGKLKGSAGAIGDDIIKVTAQVETESAEPGTWPSTITGYSFEGAENYDISLSGSGPEVTIREEIVAASISFDDNSPMNGMYFANDRTMTAAVKSWRFSEDLVSLNISVNGAGGTYSLSQVREGVVPGVTLAGGPEGSGNITMFSLLFGDRDGAVENAYTFEMTYDGIEADTGDSVAPGEFVIDEVSPVITAGFTGPKGEVLTPGETETAAPFAAGAVTAKLTVTDKSFSASGVSVTVTSKDPEGNDSGAYPEASSAAPSSSEWDSEGNVHTFTMDPFENDARYSIAAKFTDLAGNNAAGYGPVYFTVDTEAPAGTLVVRTSDGQEKEYSKTLNEEEIGAGSFKFAFSLFDRNITLISRAEDSASGIASVEYYLADVDKEAEAGFTQEADLEALNWKTWKEEDWETGIPVETDRIFTVYEKITDKAGNITYTSSGGGIIIDTKDPETPQVTVSSTTMNVYRNNIDVRISSSDPDSEKEGVFSGIKTLSYKIINDVTGEVTEQGGIDADGPRQRDLELNITVQASENNSNRVTLIVTAEDYAGNISENERNFAFDTTAPSISIGFDDSGVKNGRYFNTTREVTVTFTERNFNAGQSKLMVRTDGTDVALTMAQLMDGKGAAYGISVKSVDDTQKDTPWRERTDDRQMIYRILIGDGADADRDYEGLKFSCQDDAGNRAEKAEETYAMFTVDKVAPLLSVTYASGNKDVTERIGSNKEAPYYTHGRVTPKLTVTDRNFYKKGITVLVSQKDSDGNDVSAYSDGSVNAVQEKEWEKDGSTSSFVMDAFSGDANYGLSIETEDLAGNTARAYSEHYFTVDNTPPTGAIVVTSGDGSGTYTGFSGNIRFEFMDNEPIAVANRAEDATSGVASVSYYKYTPPVYARGTFKGLSLKKLREVNWTEWNSTLSVRPDSQAVVYARIMDRAGNILYINTAGAMIADRTSPSAPEITINAPAPSGGIFRSNVPVSVSVEDVLSGGTFSGLSNVTIEVMSSGNVTQRYSTDFGPKEDRQKTFSYDLTIDAGRNNSNNVVVRVTAKDYAGNVSGMERELKIDVTAPRIEVTYDNNDPVNGRYYNKPRTATVTVYERNFDPSGVRFDASGSPRISGWTIGSAAGQSDDNKNTCTVVFEEDAEYSFTLSVTDIAGNSADYGKTDRFVVDRTDPVISVTFDNNNGNGRYYNVGRTATITVTDLSFDEDLFSAKITASLDGLGFPAPTVSGWTHRGNVHNASVTFSQDGDYSFTLDATDLAGNRARTYAQDKFTIDTTAPVITFFGVEDGSANSGTAAPGVRYEDLNIGGNKATLLLSGYRHAQREVTGEMEAFEHGGSVQLEDFIHIIDEDDVYTLTATVTDLAGNVTTDKIAFSVNRFGSNYYFSDATNDYLKSYYHMDESSIVIFEVNVDDVHDNNITIYRNGSAMTLPAGSYKIDDLSEKEDWNRYRYSMDASLFSEEGIYEVLVSSIDKAGNRQDNKLKNVPAEFAVDRTPPSAVITGVEDGGYYDEESREIGITVTDNMAMGWLRVLVDGEERASFDAEQIALAEGKLAIKLSEKESWQEVSLELEDAAGNRGTADKCRVLITTDTMTKVLHSRLIWLPPLFLAAVILALAAKKKKSEN